MTRAALKYALCASAVYMTSISQPAAATDCAALGALTLPNATIDAAESIAAGAYTPPGGRALTNLPAFCRIHGIASPVTGSQIGFEVWLPQAGWNKKLQMIGNGGYSSSFSTNELGDLVRAGYVAVATDTGHSGNDPDFARGRPESIADWGHRAVHESVVNAKRLVQAMYASAPAHSYFKGCSTGGHQGLMEAQRYPGDFDGILAGDPGNNRTHLNAGFLWQFISNHNPGDNANPIIPDSKLPMITKAVVQACRVHNGTKDGGLATDDFLTDPRSCDFDPASIQCKSGDDANCLTAPQVAALMKMYAGATDSKTGERIAFAWPYGSEGLGARNPGWSAYWSEPGKPEQPVRASYWRDWAFDANFDWWKFDWSRDVQVADERLASVINATSPDVESFRKRGGKLLVYHGLADPVVPPNESITYHEQVTEAQQRANPGLKVDAFYRLFLVPGMTHCSGGPGADKFDAQAALEKWVEQGIAPESIVASHIAEGKVTFTRPLCVYPKQARYDGKGDPTNAASFACADDGRKRNTPEIGPNYTRTK